MPTVVVIKSVCERHLRPAGGVSLPKLLDLNIADAILLETCRNPGSGRPELSSSLFFPVRIEGQLPTGASVCEVNYAIAGKNL